MTSMSRVDELFLIISIVMGIAIGVADVIRNDLE